jgi:hypothetical protein
MWWASVAPRGDPLLNSDRGENGGREGAGECISRRNRICGGVVSGGGTNGVAGRRGGPVWTEFLPNESRFSTERGQLSTGGTLRRPSSGRKRAEEFGWATMAA